MRKILAYCFRKKGTSLSLKLYYIEAEKKNKYCIRLTFLKPFSNCENLIHHYIFSKLELDLQIKKNLSQTCFYKTEILLSLWLKYAKVRTPEKHQCIVYFNLNFAFKLNQIIY